MIWKKAIIPSAIILILTEVIGYFFVAKLIGGCGELPGTCPTILEKFITLNYFILPLIIIVYLIITLIFYIKSK